MILNRVLEGIARAMDDKVNQSNDCYNRFIPTLLIPTIALFLDSASNQNPSLSSNALSDLPSIYDFSIFYFCIHNSLSPNDFLATLSKFSIDCDFLVHRERESSIVIAALFMVREEREFIAVLNRELNWSQTVMEIRTVWHRHELDQFPGDLL